MNKLNTLIHCLFFSCSLLAQTPDVTVKFLITNDQGVGVNDAYIIKKSNNQLLDIAQSGVAYFSLTETPFSIIISHIGYENQLVKINENMKGSIINDTLVIPIKMGTRTFDLSEVEISAEDSPLAYESESEHIKDYALYENTILLLISAGKKNKLKLIDAYGETIYNLIVRDKAQEIIRDCFNNIHLVYEDSIYQIRFTDHNFYLNPPYSAPKYYSSLYLCKEAISPNNFVIAYKGPYDQEVQYYLKTESRNDYLPLRRIIDIDLKLQSINYAGLFSDGKVSAAGASNFGQISSARELQREYDYFKHVIATPIYSPIFKVGNSFLLFDHKSDSLLMFNPNGKLEKSNRISYHKQKNWKDQLVYDYFTEEIYAVYKEQNKVLLKRINLSDGSLSSYSVLSDHLFPQEIKMRNGVLYYLYQDQYSRGKPQQLFKQSLSKVN